MDKFYQAELLALLRAEAAKPYAGHAAQIAAAAMAAVNLSAPEQKASLPCRFCQWLQRYCRHLK